MATRLRVVDGYSESRYLTAWDSDEGTMFIHKFCTSSRYCTFSFGNGKVTLRGFAMGPRGNTVRILGSAYLVHGISYVVQLPEGEVDLKANRAVTVLT